MRGQNFDINDYYVSADGNHHLIQGDTTAAAGDDILVVDGAVVIQEDSILPGLAAPVSVINDPNMVSNGDWYARGSNDDGKDWGALQRSDHRRDGRCDSGWSARRDVLGCGVCVALFRDGW